jgi:hypothetical protein
MEPKCSPRPANSANQPHEIAAFGLFEDEVTNDRPRFLETAEESADAGSNRRSSAAPPPPGNQTNAATASSLGLGSQEPLSVSNSLSYALAVEIECRVR